MADFFKALGNTVEAIGGAVAAPVGVAYDMATSPFDDQDDDFGSLLDKVGSRGGDMLDPFRDQETLTGALFGKTMEGLEWAYREGISEPLSTTWTVAGHAAFEKNPLEFFDGESWAQAYQIAQNRSIGQSFSLANQQLGPFVGAVPGVGPLLGMANSAGGGKVDPLSDEAWKQNVEAAPFAANLASGTTDFIARWYLDPGIVAGKAAGAWRAKTYLGRLGKNDRLGLLDEMEEGRRKTFGVPAFVHKATDKKSRTDSFLDFINGSNQRGKALNGEEIYLASPELRRSANGRQVSSLLADAAEFGPNAQRRVLAVAMGDATQIDRLRAEVHEAGAIADALSNLRNGGTLDLKSMALNTDAKLDPARIASIQAQIDNLNHRGQVNEFIETTLKQLDDQIKTGSSMLDTASTLGYVPRAHKAGDKALKRAYGERAIDKTAAAHDAVLNRAREFSRDEAVSGVFQKSVHQMPLLLVKTAGLPASPYTKMPKAISDALRQTHYVGVANLHDWNSSLTQLDSMMRVAGVDDATRIGRLAEGGGLRSEMDKRLLIERTENLAMQTLAGKYGVDREFTEQLMMAGSLGRQKNLAALRGRAYASTPDANGTRVDQILDEQGVPLAAPLLESQLANSIPLIDIHLAKKVLERRDQAERIKHLSDAWRREATDLRGLQAMVKRGEAGAVDRYEKLVLAKQQAMDYIMLAAQDMTRVWKFSVLFRLGYPMRVVMDDHMRIASQINAGSFYFDNGAEFGRNWWYNRAPKFINGQGRKAEAARAYTKALSTRDELRTAYGYGFAHSEEDFDAIKKAVVTLRRKKATRADKANAQALIDNLDPDGTIATYFHRVKDIEKARRRAASFRSREMAGEADAAESHLQYLMEQMGDTDLALVRKELESVQDSLEKGEKFFREEFDKRFVGSEPVTLNGPEGFKVAGAYGGDSGDAFRGLTSSAGTFDVQMYGHEDSVFNIARTGSWRTIQPTEAEHLSAWADTLNHQFRNSRVAMHFVRGGSVDEFVEKLATDPKFADLKERLPHYAQDPEDWGRRVEAMVRDYLPTPELREHVASNHINARTLGKMMPDQSARPIIHGQAAAVQFGTATAAGVMGRGISRIYRLLGEMPTDRLSRHPFFNSLYKAEVQKQADILRLARQAEGKQFTQADLPFIERQARKVALNHLKNTLFDMSAHSHAAHVMRFVSPFFAAHQESLSRWWRIVQDNPQVIRRFQQAFDMPRKVGLVYDTETGEPVKSGEPISANHRIMLRVPGAEDSTINRWLKKVGGGKEWSVNENGFNLVLQGGLMNPGAGPVVTVPVEYLAQKYADRPNIDKMARILNPYQPDSPLDAVSPAWAQRLYALGKGLSGKGMDSAEWANRYSKNLDDLAITFAKDNGRPPTNAEFDALLERAGHETNRDMFFMFLSNTTSPVPAKPESKYAVVQHGLSQIRAKAKAEGRDWEWVRDQFVERYGDIYMAMLYSTSNNAGRFEGTPGEVSAVKRYKPLLSKIDPKLARMVVGPAAYLAGQEDKAMAAYSGQARLFLENQSVSPGSADTYISDKTPRDQYIGLLVSEGWDRYNELTNGLQLQAEQMGLKDYRESPELMKAKSFGVDAIKAENFAWAADFDSFDKGKFETYLDDMRQIASAKVLTGDTERQDIYWLGQYLAVRDTISAELARRKSLGLSGDPTAKSNAPLMLAFSNVVSIINEQSTFFKDYAFDGILEFDPFLKSAEEATVE